MTSEKEVLQYWFGDDPDDLEVIHQKRKLWFGKSDRVDEEIRQRFSERVDWAEKRCRGESSSWSPFERLVAIILLDQFPRNIYRGKAKSFSYDSLALALTLEGLALHQDLQMRPIQRVFFYLPLEHSEDLTHQNRSVALFELLVESHQEIWRDAFEDFADYARRHRDIIARFGRFPHRNAILGRSSTPEEIAFLHQPNSSF